MIGNGPIGLEVYKTFGMPKITILFLVDLQFRSYAVSCLTCCGKLLKMERETPTSDVRFLTVDPNSISPK